MSDENKRGGPVRYAIVTSLIKYGVPGTRAADASSAVLFEITRVGTRAPELSIFDLSTLEPKHVRSFNTFFPILDEFIQRIIC